MDETLLRICYQHRMSELKTENKKLCELLDIKDHYIETLETKLNLIKKDEDEIPFDEDFTADNINTKDETMPHSFKEAAAMFLKELEENSNDM